jgi:hypothetical protein
MHQQMQCTAASAQRQHGAYACPLADCFQYDWKRTLNRSNTGELVPSVSESMMCMYSAVSLNGARSKCTPPGAFEIMKPKSMCIKWPCNEAFPLVLDWTVRRVVFARTTAQSVRRAAAFVTYSQAANKSAACNKGRDGRRTEASRKLYLGIHEDVRIVPVFDLQDVAHKAVCRQALRKCRLSTLA